MTETNNENGAKTRRNRALKRLEGLSSAMLRAAQPPESLGMWIRKAIESLEQESQMSDKLIDAVRNRKEERIAKMVDELCPPKLNIKEARERCEKAREELSYLCHGFEFKMRIPVNKDDSDQLLLAPLTDLPAALGWIEEAREVIKENSRPWDCPSYMGTGFYCSYLGENDCWECRARKLLERIEE